MSPEIAVPSCLDACGYEISYIYSPDFKYLVRFSGGNAPVRTAILALQTLVSKEITQKFYSNPSLISFPNPTTLSFKGSETEGNDKEFNVTIDLQTAKVTIQ